MTISNQTAVEHAPIEAQEPSISPIEAITALLVAGGHPQPSLWLAGLDQGAFEVKDESIQRFLINRYWRMQIQGLNEDTLNVRYCLVDEAHIPTADWLRIFTEGVLPCILKNKIPSLMID